MLLTCMASPAAGQVQVLFPRDYDDGQTVTFTGGAAGGSYELRVSSPDASGLVDAADAFLDVTFTSHTQFEIAPQYVSPGDFTDFYLSGKTETRGAVYAVGGTMPVSEILDIDVVYDPSAQFEGATFVDDQRWTRAGGAAVETARTTFSFSWAAAPPMNQAKRLTWGVGNSAANIRCVIKGTRVAELDDLTTHHSNLATVVAGETDTFGSSGIVSVEFAAPEYEAGGSNEYTVRIYNNIDQYNIGGESGSTGCNGSALDVRFTVRENSAPVFGSSTAAYSMDENTAAGQNVGAALTATDTDNDTLTYSLEGTDAASFDIVAASGQIKTKMGVSYTYEAQNTYAVTVKADDGFGGTDTVAVTIALNDVDEQPDKPAAPTLEPVSGSTTSLTASWMKPGLNGGPDITGYDVRYRQGTSGGWNDFTHDGTGVTATITGLTADTEYQVQVRAKNEETPSDWSDPSDAVRTNAEGGTPTPQITNVAVTSSPRLETDTYGEGETIEISVTFDEAVNATSDTDFVLSVSGPKRAPLVRGSGTATLVFGYTVQSGDSDSNGIWIGDQDRTLVGNRNGDPQNGTITSVATGTAADLTHGQLGALSGHKVDGSRTAGEPVEVTLHLSDSEVAEGASAVTVTATASPASATAFTVTVSASAVDPATDDDFELSSNRVLSFDANATDSTGTVTIAPVDDGDPEPNQVVTVSGSASIADVIDPGDVTLTIRDDDLVRISGICNRTPRVEDRILVLLKNRHRFKGGCGDVNETHLAKLESLDLGRNPSTESAFTLSLRSDDFEGLVNIERLYLRETGLRSLPAGVFDGLAALEELELDKNRLRSLPAGVFSDLRSLQRLELQQNPSLRSLPYDELEALPNLTELRVDPQGRRGYQMAGSERDVELEVPAGRQTTYQVRLTHRPSYSPREQPTLTVSSDMAGVVATPTTLRFTRENWFRRQTVRVIALSSAAGNTATLSHTSVAVTLDRPIPTVTVRVLERSEGGGSSEPLSADFEGLPSSHDGESAFSFRIAFSEDVATSAADMRDHALTVTGGAVTNAARVDGRDDLWRITVRPSGADAVSILLPSGRDCAEAGAICTADSRQLAVGFAVEVPSTSGGRSSGRLTAAFEGLPSGHDGESAFSFRIAFSEDVATSASDMRDQALTVTGGAVTNAARVDGRSDLWRYTVRPSGDDDIEIQLPARDCAQAGAVCTEEGRKLHTGLLALIASRSEEPERNTAATGAPTIGGTPQVGEELTASTSGISDADGLDDARFAYQWIRAASHIQGATGSTYTAVEADEGERLKVRVVFTDDAGNAESLTSAATDAVAARPEPLTASFEGMPAEHRGEGGFHFRVAFSEDIGISFKALREDAFAVTGGRVTGGKRVDGRRDLFRMTVRPDSDAAVTITLPAGRECGVSGAICTKGENRRQLTNSPSARVRGPVGISVADARVEEDDGAVLVFLVTLSRAAGGTLAVDYATSDGSAHAGVDYTAASGRLSFRTGESSKKIEVGVLDDAHDEGEETLALTLSNASGGRLTDGDATGTIENRDPLPRALLARFGRTAAVHVVEHVEERLQAPREPGFRGRFAGRELRRGMERDMALNFLRQLGGSAGVHPAGMGSHTAMAGSPAVGAVPLGTPGRGGGALMMGGGGPMSGAAGMAGGAASVQTPGLGAAGFGGAAPLGAGPAGGPSGLDGGLNGGGFLQMGLGGGDLLTGSDFAMNRESRGGILSFWSRGAQSRFSGREGALSLGGDVRTTMFGADYARGPVVAGLSLSNSRGLGEYAGVAGGQVASSVTGLYPWLGYKMTERVTVWGVAGYGTGGLLLTPDGGQALESGLSMAMAAAGTRGELLAGGASGFELAFKADALWVGTAIDGVDGPAGRLKATDAAVTRFRTGLEGSRAYTLGGRLSLKPSVEVGLRHDGGDAETGAGMDVGAGMVLSDAGTGLAVDLRVRTLLVHQDEDFSERGVSLSLSYNPTPSTPLGFTARVAPSWGGQARSGAAALWGRETMAGMARGGVAQGNRLDGEVGYGLPVGRRFVGTPRIGFSTSEYGQDYRVGYGLGVLDRESLAFELGVEAQRRNSPMLGGTSNGMLGRATLGW